ncbi:hypothetical protein EJ04DRAFT_514753 [Polyplosphaeria fusca]|uniref:DNA replication regulator Sld3 C-terminal domain-containing protein n=1 Tax=Polyplosphaeria fusca TaxID=682080 RepID=A0A9P4QUF4_9PLEO|nr:hypothetical protein EJ04DRAFT_514753 [Polyplosphaeria fusca]
MASYALLTKAMLESVSSLPTHILGLPAKPRLESKPQLPTKRKRDSICGLGTFNQPFTIKPSPESPYDKPQVFKPVRIIGRSQLPLTLLDTSPNSTFTPNTLFAATIDVLETHHEAQTENIAPPKILIARYETNKALYAIERVQPRVFSLCKLAGWLKEKDVGELWDPSTLDTYPAIVKVEHTDTPDEEWWNQAAIKINPEEPAAKRPRISMLRAKPAPVDPKSMLPRCDSALDSGPTDANMANPLNIITEPSTPQQLLETFVQQYLETIYMSKTSLAYFAKGPVSRIRTAFTYPDEDAPPTFDLVTFMRSMLLSHKVCDKKYREKLPEIIKSIPPSYFSDDDAGDGTQKAKKSKKKTKLNREGVYPQEDEVVKRWWTAELPSPEIYGEESLDQRIKRRIADLRVRETLAQMILMLEIIALEALSTFKETQQKVQDADTKIKDQDEMDAKPKRRKKKLDDIKLLLDLLLDKLCIWQTVEEDEIFDFEARSSGKAGSGDRLQSFCVEVIVPFYMNRLPEQAIMINKKLGGPVQASPPKRKAMKPPVASRESGEPKEPDPKKPRRTLGRVATDTIGQNTQQRVTPSLNRSTTDPAMLNSLKREVSEVPLSAIPFQRSPSTAARQSLASFKHLKGREIDLSAPSAAAAAKIKHKQRVAEDLKDAISALKKPNRGLAAGGYVDDIEKRGLGIGPSSRSRKQANPVRKPAKDIQVSATPRAVRMTMDVSHDARTPSRQANPFLRDSELNGPPSNDFCIPSSTIRPKASFGPESTQRIPTARLLAEHGVAETPTKAPREKLFTFSGVNRKMIFATPQKTIPAFQSPEKISSTPPVHAAVFATPTKGSSAVAESPLAISQPAKDDQDGSIYDALGWNDDDELL